MFIAAMFKKQFEPVGGYENWEIIYTDYVDMSGVANTRETQVSISIFNIDARLTAIELFLYCIEDYYKATGLIYEDPVKSLRNYAHKLVWNNDWPGYQAQINRIRSKEAKRKSERDGLEKELDKLKTHGMKANNITNSEKNNFTRLINALQKENGYPFDRDKTMMDAFSLMQKEYTDACNEAKNRK